ncbi:NAD(P)-binding protein [Patellaria atrata CBS 101060]|uniref:D-arabinitol 2-dehydrogenase [ribulose-forming] n=1 Tax=Patellaria atrata CBS 101060 TaxID=1346257 RepID=A0A9P4S7M8_9PEZI|nr:NAD(P)-binding protein [Patellaria atrata CBS 101060]
MPDNISERDALVNRQLPEMRLSDGSSGSMTGPPAPPPHYLNAEGRAQYRFAIEGNAAFTGGAGTLALENARALLEHGLSGLALLDIRPEQSSEAISKLQEDFPSARVTTRRVNVTSPEDVNVAMRSVKEELGSIDMLCCFAGVVGCTHATEMHPSEWKRTLDINLNGSFFSAQAAAKEMIAQGNGGAIVFIASISAHRVNFPQPQVAYNTSKAAILQMKSSLAAEWARYGIRVNSLSPGYMDTVLNEGQGLERARNIWASRNPMGRMGYPQELAGPLILLCSGAGSFINGADLVVDGMAASR